MTDLATIGFRADVTGLIRAERSLDSLADEGERTERRLNRSTQSSGEIFKKLAGTIGIAGTALATLRVSSSTINSFKIFETGLVGVSKTTGLTGTELDKFSKKIQSLTLTLPVTTAELLELSQAAGQMGVSGSENLEKFAVTIAKLGRASDLSGELAAKSLARILNVTGESVGSIDTLASVIVSLGNNSEASESEIARMTSEIARATSVFNVTSSQAAGLAAAMASIGIQAELGGSSVGRTMQVLTNAVVGGEKELTKFTESLGINAEALKAAFDEDRVKAFEIVLQAVAEQGLNAGAVLKEVGLGGQEIAKTIIPLANNMSILNEKMALASAESENATALNKEYSATLNTLQSQQDLATNSLEAYSREIGQRLSPAFRGVLGLFNEFGSTSEQVSNNVTAVTNSIKSMSSVVGGVMVASLVKSTAARIADTIASTSGNLAVAKSNNLRAVSAAQVALQDQLAATRSLANAANEGLRANAITRLAAANGALIATNRGVAASTLAVAAATRAASVSVGVLTAATRVLMGPFGLLITALGVGAAAFALTSETAAKTTDVIEDNGKAVRDLTDNYNNLTKAQIESAKISVNKRLIEIDKEIAAIKNLKSITDGLTGANLASVAESFGMTSNEISEASTKSQAAIDALNQEADKLISLLIVTSDASGQAGKSLDALADVVVDKGLKSFMSMTSAIAMQRQQLLLSADEFEIYKLRIDAAANGVDQKLIPSLVAAAKANQNLRGEMAGNESIDDLTNSVENYGGAWTRTGSTIIDTFGSMTDALGEYMNRVNDLDIRERDIAKAKKEGSKGNAQIIKLEQGLQFDRTLAELDGIKRVSTASQGLFDEKTAASKAFAALNQLITVAEIAMMVTRMTAGTAEASAHVANETSKQGANALTAVTGAFAAPFPINFVAGAAMIGIMAGLVGGSFGGGSSFDATQSRQESQGTGTVLGSDEKSASIINAQGRFEDIALDQLDELRGIQNSMSSLAEGISRLAISFVSGSTQEFAGDLTGSNFSDSAMGRLTKSFDPVSIVADLIGLGDAFDSFVNNLFGKTSKKILDSGIQFISQSLGEIVEGGIVEAQAFFDIETKKSKLFGLVSSSSTGTDLQAVGGGIQEQMGAIFAHIGDVVLQSAESLGFETVEIVKESIGGSVFNLDGLGDFMSVTFSKTFAKVEVGLEEALSSFNVNIGKISLEGLNGDEIQAELEAVFSQQSDLIAEFLVPSIADFQQIGEGLFDTLTRVTKEQAVFNDSMATMGFDLNGLSNVMSIDVAQSIITMIGGLDAFTDATSEFFSSFFTEQENFNILTNSLSEAMGSLGQSIPVTRQGFRQLVESLDLTTGSGQQMFASLMQLTPAMDAYFETIEQGQADALNASADALQQSIDLEKQRASVIVGAARAVFSTEMARIELQRSAVLEQQSLADQSLKNTELMLKKSIELEKNRANLILSSANDIFNAQVSNIAIQRSSLSEQKSMLESSLAVSEQMIGKSIDIEKQRATAILAISQDVFNSEVARISAQRDSLKDQQSLLQQSSLNSIDALKKSFQFEQEAIQNSLAIKINSINEQASIEQELITSLSNQRIEGMNAELNLLSDRKSGLSAIFSDLKSLANSTRDAAGLGSNDISGALQSARSGNFTQAQGLSGQLPSSSGFSSAADFKVAEETAKGQLAQISDLASGKASSTQLQIQAIDAISLNILNQIESEKINADLAVEQSIANSELEIAYQNLNAEMQTAALEKQLNTLLNIDTSILSLSDAIQGFSAASSTLSDFDLDGLNSALDFELEIAQQGLNNAQSNHTQQLATLDSQLNTLLNIDTSVLNLSDSIDELNAANAEIESLDFQMLSSSLDIALEVARADLALAQNARDEQVASLDNQLNATLGIDTSVLNLVDSTAAYQEAQLQMDSLHTEMMLEKLGVAEETALALLDQSELAYTDEITRLDLILDNAQAQIDLLDGISENTLTTTQALESLASSIQSIQNQPAPVSAVVNDVADEIQNKQRVLDSATMRAMAKNTASTAKILQRIELGGLDTRAITE